jgi:hypothetical protein
MFLYPRCHTTESEVAHGDANGGTEAPGELQAHENCRYPDYH